MKTIAIITGATGGIGKEFVRELIKEPLDEIWIIGRKKERLDALCKQYGERIIPICKDLTNSQNLQAIQTLLQQQLPCIKYLINNAGVASMMESTNFDVFQIDQTINLNCKVPTILINYCIPFMNKGSRILNISSASAFQPVPFINLYASTKAFELSYSRAINMELKPLEISATAVCPSWVDTEMLTKEINAHKVKFRGMVRPEKVVQKAIKDAKKGKDISICGLYVMLQRFNVKLLPHKLIMRFWLRDVRKYL